MKTKKQLCKSALITAVLVLIDRITKLLAVHFLKNKEPIPIIKDVFELEYLENSSAAFGMDPISLLHRIFSFEIFYNNPELFLQIRMGFFVLITIAIVLLLAFIYKKIPNEKRFIYMDWIILFFIAGAIGNFIDRISYQYVIDFFYFKLINFPVFNVADIYVTCAAFAMAFMGIFYYKDEDFERIFPSKPRQQ